MAGHLQPHRTPFWRIPRGLALLSALVVLVFYLLREHASHVVGSLPYLLLLACPLLHLLGHRHGGGDGKESGVSHDH